MSFHVPERYRLRLGRLKTDSTAGNNGAFIFDSVLPGRRMVVIASDGSDWQSARLGGEPWEHVSVHIEQGKKQLTPTWIEMCAAKEMFWEADDVVIQFHPRKSDYVNNHPNTLHLWRPIKSVLPLPPSITVGYKELGEMTCEQAEQAIKALEEQAALKS